MLVIKNKVRFWTDRDLLLTLGRFNVKLRLYCPKVLFSMLADVDMDKAYTMMEHVNNIVRFL